MGEEEVLNFLEEQKKLNPNKWFSTNEVIEGLKEKGFVYSTGNKGIRRNLRQLSVYGLIKFKTVGFWEAKLIFRAK